MLQIVPKPLRLTWIRISRLKSIACEEFMANPLILNRHENKMKEKAPRTVRNLLQVRLSDNEKRNIKMMAAGQGLTLREATLAAFTAWAEKLRAQAAASKAAKAPGQR
jgi:hypothetical protein